MSDVTHQGAETNRRRAVERAEEVLGMRGRGMSYEDISEALSVSTDVARQIVSRHNKRTATQAPVRKYRVRRDND